MSFSMCQSTAIPARRPISKRLWDRWRRARVRPAAAKGARTLDAATKSTEGGASGRCFALIFRGDVFSRTPLDPPVARVRLNRPHGDFSLTQLIELMPCAGCRRSTRLESRRNPWSLALAAGHRPKILGFLYRISWGFLKAEKACFVAGN